MVLKKLMGIFSSAGEAGLGAGDAKKTAEQTALTYEAARQVLASGKVAARKAVAESPTARPEMLYYLASDSSVTVRRAVAVNAATPVQADEILAADEDAEVRTELARKVARLVPDLTGQEQTALRERTIAILARLAEDALPKVRQIVAEEIKASDAVPKNIVLKLAADVSTVVAVPILQYSPLLNDDDLKEIIAAGVAEERLSAIARRPNLPADIADEIVSSLEVPAIAALLVNKGAQIREATLDRIIDQAEHIETLHRPLAFRPALSIRAMRRIAGFVASALVHAMIESAGVGEDVAEDVLERVRERLASERVGEDEEARLHEFALQLHDRGQLDDAWVLEQIETGGRRELMIQCLGVMAEIDAPIVRKILASKSGRAVTALAWKAGLKMRTAVELQTRFALVPNAQLVYAKDGRGYPFADSELNWHLSYFLD